MTTKPSTMMELPPRTRWRGAVAILRLESSPSRLVGGSLVMLIGSSIVSVFNFAYNVAVARLLGPAAFSHAAAAITLLMLVSSITLAFQLVCAKFVARNESHGAKVSVYHALRRKAWMVGLGLGTGLIAASSFVAQYLHLPSASLVVLLAVGMAFYIPVGVKRGALQGTCSFTRLISNFVLEAVVKLVAAVVLAQLGYGVYGAVLAISGSVIIAYFLPPMGGVLEGRAEPGLPASFREGIQAITFFVGQVIINNIDILLVKHFFAPAEAGLYAGIALVGRVLYFVSWSVVSAMFPISAGAKQEREGASVLLVPTVFVLSLSVGLILFLSLFPEFVLRTVFGPGFHAAAHGMESLLSLNAAASGAYALSVVLMAYEMSRKIANTGWVQLAFSGVIILGLYFWHESLWQVVMVQLLLRVLLLLTVLLPFFWARRIPALQEAA